LKQPSISEYLQDELSLAATILKILTFANKHKSLTQRISMWSEQEYFSDFLCSYSVFKHLQMTISFVSKMNLWLTLK